MAKKDEQLVWATRPFGYLELSLDRGQVFTLRGERNDERLVSFGYVKPLDKDDGEPYQCSDCGAKFVAEGMRRDHGRKRHPSRPRSEEEEDLFLDNEDQTLARIAPVGPGLGAV